MTQCKGRVTKESLKVVFSDNKHYFYLELKCSNTVTSGALCLKCSTRNTTCAQSSKSFNHGSMDEPIPEKSHIFDGSWYKKAMKSYGEPSEDNLKKAVEAKNKARGDIDSLVEYLGNMTLEPVAKKKRVVRVKKPVVGLGVESTGVITTIPVDSIVESTDEPLEVQEVIYIVLKPFMNDLYWRDEDRDKIYKNDGGKKGAYVGRWDSEKIVECPDSDED